jgi:hypothetical protein
MMIDMVIREERRTFIHTCFTTDGRHLGEAQARTLRLGMIAALRDLHLWADVRLESGEDEGLEIVLTCQPAEGDLRVLRAKLAKLLEPLPAARPETPPPANGPYR